MQDCLSGSMGLNAQQAALFAEWSARHPDDAADFLLAEAGPVHERSWSPSASSGDRESDRLEGCNQSIMAVGLRGGPRSMREVPAQSPLWWIVCDPAELFQLMRSSLFADLLQSPSCHLRFWPAASLDGRWKWPSEALLQLSNGSLLFKSHPDDHELLQRVQASGHRALLLLQEGVVSPHAPLVNWWHNLVQLPRSHRMASLEQIAAGLPILIVGGGPSSARTVAHIRTVQDRVLVMAGGAGLTICAQQGLRPDIACLVDPSPSQILHAKPWAESGIPLLTTLRCHAPTLASWQGPLLFSPRPDDPVAGSLAECWLGLDQPILESDVLDVVGMLSALALWMGASSIHWVGRELSQPVCCDKGKQITTPHWRAIAEASAWMIRRHPEVQWIGHSAHGLPIPGLDIKSFSTDLFGSTPPQKLSAVRQVLQRLAPSGVAMDQATELQEQLQRALAVWCTRQPIPADADPYLLWVDRLIQGLTDIQLKAVEESDPHLGQWKGTLKQTMVQIARALHQQWILPLTC